MMPIWDFSWQKWNDVIVVSRTSLKNVVRKTFQMRQQAWIRKRTWSQRDVSSWSARLWWCDCDEMPRRCQIDDLLGVMSIYCYSTISCTSLSFLIWKLQQFFFLEKGAGWFLGHAKRIWTRYACIWQQIASHHCIFLGRQIFPKSSDGSVWNGKIGLNLSRPASHEKTNKNLPGTWWPSIYKWLAINWMMNPIFT